MIIFIEDSFDSAHWLPNVPDGHKCKNIHGHTYKIRIEVRGSIGKFSGWVIDYSEIKEIWGRIKLVLDHKCLNDISGLENSTCELLVEWVWGKLVEMGLNLRRLEIRETEHCGAIKEGGS